MSRGAESILAGLLCIVAAYHVALALTTMFSFALRHPLQDEFAMTLRYLTHPFPSSILELVSGHRPVIPGLVRWVELEWLGGSRGLQMATAWCAAAFCIAAIMREAWQGLRETALLRTAAVCLCATLLLWNANARMFIHTFEAVHIFYVTAAVVWANLAALRALGSDRPWLWWALSMLGCIAATLSLGTGTAAFASILVIAFIGRATGRVQALVFGGALLFFILYAWALPGGDGVRQLISLPDPQATVFFWLLRMGSVLAEITRHKVTVAFAASMLSIAMIAAIAVLWMRGHRFSRLEAFAASVFAFGAATNAAIAFVRTEYFFIHPDQIFAERYLYWSCIPWTGMGLFAFARLSHGGRIAHVVAACVLLAFSIALIAPARRLNSWAGSEYRDVELGAMAVRMDVRIPQPLERITDGEPQIAYGLAREMRSRRLGDFRESADIRLGSRLVVSGTPEIRIDASTTPVPGATVPNPLFQISASAPMLAGASREARYWLVDRDGVVVGAAGLTSPARHPTNIAHLGLPRFDLLEGYTSKAEGNVLLVGAGQAGTFLVRAELEISRRK